MPATVLAEALLLRAQSFHDEEHWSDAANLWSEALGNLPAGNPERNKVLYALGYCQRQLNQMDEARRSWEEVCQNCNDELGQAASLFLAQIDLQTGQLEPSLARLKQAVQTITRPEDWKNPRVPLIEVRKFFESAGQSYRQAGNFALATELAALYAKVAVPNLLPSFEAETAAEHGRALRAEAQKNQDITARGRQEEEANRLLAQAGQGYVKAAAVPGLAADEQVKKLWLAVTCFREVPDNNQVIAILQEVAHRDHQRAAEAWYLLGEALRSEKRLDEAKKAYEDCIKVGDLTPFPFRARYQHSVIVFDQREGPNETAKAEEALDQNLKLMTSPGIEPDPEAYEKTLLTLGSRWFEKKRFSNAARRLEEFVHQYAANPQAPRAQYQLAESYRQIAIGFNRDAQGRTIDQAMQEHFRMEYRTWMSKAADEYYQLAKFLDKPENETCCLTSEERIQVQFMAADCRFNLGRYDDCAPNL